MDLSEIFRIGNLAVGVFVFLGGLGQFWPSISPQGIILAIYLFIFGGGICLLEFQIPPFIARYASFMFSFIGRGIFYIFLGGIIVGAGVWWRWVSGSLVLLVGVLYVILEYIPSIEPPANMRSDADQNWGAEQI